MTVMATTLVHESPKLGEVPYAPEDVVRFPQGLPGFERLREFLLVTREECAPFIFLASLERPEVALPMMPLLPELIGVGADAMPAMLGRAGRNGVVYHAVVTFGPDGRQVRANLRAPVVVNLDTRLGCQVVLPDETLPLDAEIF